ncbi:hypothetical protein FPZ42_12835 [Mucilaginibacter achroorhodeus]|uniref:Uncharacterized protein n=1 Tax=Mucilaginibacter achroorhodeus TaxID=2599294 RepID=A0A563U1I7_9SPHI|nr:hypothetical protein [Mucilaginibacter achroorhodeus]TWR25478.1 hypothetical protein FPZ42_12835 [Mucilaginibacter achroorhodeus]
MKASIIYFLAISFLFAGCGNSETNSDFSGSYVNKAQSEYSIAFDTLILSKKSELSYEIERKTGFQKIRNGSIMAKEFKSERWSAQWNKDNMFLSETELGRQITFSEDGKSLSLKGTEYLKIK